MKGKAVTDLSYTLFLNCRLIDLECDLPEDAIEWGERQLAQECIDSDEPSGSWDAELVTRQWDDDLGWQEIERKPVTLYYEEGRSDRDEHFNEGDYL